MVENLRGCGLTSQKNYIEGWEGMGILWNNTIKHEFLSCCSDVIFL